jgi:hypothetical protein
MRAQIHAYVLTLTCACTHTGWNPHFQDREKSAEPWIIGHKFDKDFYGGVLQLPLFFTGDRRVNDRGLNIFGVGKE